MIQKHPNHIALGIGMMMICIWLIANDIFFQWQHYAVDGNDLSGLNVFKITGVK